MTIFNSRIGQNLVSVGAFSINQSVFTGGKLIKITKKVVPDVLLLSSPTNTRTLSVGKKQGSWSPQRSSNKLTKGKVMLSKKYKDNLNATKKNPRSQLQSLRPGKSKRNNFIPKRVLDLYEANKNKR